MPVPTTLRMRPRDLGAAIDTIVLVMMENRSFDHLLGWLSLPPYGNRTDVDGLKGPIDSTTRELTDPSYRNRGRNRIWRPYVADRDVPLRTDLPHGRDRVRTQMHYVLPGYLADAQTGEKYQQQGFAMDGFPEAYFDENPGVPWGLPECDPMMMMPPALLPATSFLAREYMVCDRWFSPIPTDTHPNRLMSLCGFTKIDTTSGEPLPLPDHWSVVDWCEERNLRWRVYGQALSFLMLFRARRPGGLELDPKRFRRFGALADDFRKESSATFPNLVIVEPAYSDDPLGRRLGPTDNHPPNPMRPGEAFLADVYRAVTANPKRFERTVMIVVYDEHGGFWDHVPPFPVTTPPPGYEDDAWKDRTPFTTSGPRVPAIVVSPLVARGSVSHLRFDHTSILQLLADIAEPGYAFSEIVGRRHTEGRIQSLSAALSDTPLQARPPVMPAIARAAPAVVPQVATAGQASFSRLQRDLTLQGRLALGEAAERLDEELETALGPFDAYDVVGWPGVAMRAPLRTGDVLVRTNPDDPARPLVARITGEVLRGRELFPPGTEAEGGGDGWYAETIERTRDGWTGSPTLRVVVDPDGTVQAGQIVLRRAGASERG